MFKNPLKYQQGGSTQDAMKQLVAWLVQNTGLDEGQVSQRLSQILSDDTAKQELVSNLQNMQKGDQEAAERIKNMFVPQNAKLGGKIQDFICKHGKGGKTGCGCKQDGGSIRPEFKYLGTQAQQDGLYPNRWNVIAHGYNIGGREIARSTGQGGYWMNDEKGAGYENGEKVYSPEQMDSLINFYENVLPSANRVQGPKEKLAGMESGGKVVKAQGGSGSIWGPVYTDENGRWRNFYDEYNGFAGTVNMNTGRAYKASTDEEMLQPGRYNRKGYPIAEGSSTNGTWYEVTPRGGIVVNIPEGGQQVLHGTDSTGVANLINQWDQSKVGHAVTAKENGGNLKKKKMLM